MASDLYKVMYLKKNSKYKLYAVIKELRVRDGGSPAKDFNSSQAIC